MYQRVGRMVVALAAGLALAVLPVAPVQAATPDLAITWAALTYPHNLPQVTVWGTVTCAEPTGEAEILLYAMQGYGGGSGVGWATVPCAAGPVPWQVEVLHLFGDEFTTGGIFLVVHAYQNGYEELYEESTAHSL